MKMVAAQKTITVLILFIIGLFEASQATVHNVGDSAGWTILGHVDYKKWASSKTFHTGDSLLFVYNSKFHDVKQVSHQDFMSCNASSPVATYASGSDTVALKRPGNYYFLCGFPGHCQAGQKLDVLVNPDAAGPAIAPASSPSAGSPSGSAASAPETSAQNGAVSSSVPTILAAALVGLIVYVVDSM